MIDLISLFKMCSVELGHSLSDIHDGVCYLFDLIACLVGLDTLGIIDQMTSDIVARILLFWQHFFSSESTDDVRAGGSRCR